MVGRWTLWFGLALAGCDASGGGAAVDAAGPADATPMADGVPADAAPVQDGAMADMAPAEDAGPSPDTGPGFACVVDPAELPPYLQRLGCFDDFAALGSAPLDATIPGARSIKTVIDRVDGDALYFTNTHDYPIHWDFASAHLSGRGLPVVPRLPEFNRTEYSAPSRRFLLGAVTWYAGPEVFVYEIAPYDTADAEMIAGAWRRITADAWFGEALRFHPTSVAQEQIALPGDVPLITTDALFAGVDYQPLNVGESYGRLRFVRAEDLGEEFLSFRDIAVLDRVPNDISVVSGLITEAFQTPLSHVNVLSRNRGTPNMALRGAFSDPALRALEGEWVRLVVGPGEYRVEIAPREAADAWWEAHRPEAVQLPGVDLAVRDLREISAAIDLEAEPLGEAVKTATRAFGGKAAHYAALTHVEGLPVRPGLAVPVVHYFEFMEVHGFSARVAGWLEDPEFTGDPAVRDARLAELREAMLAAPLVGSLNRDLLIRLRSDFPDTRMRFRSSTNAEDLDGFTGAGLYTSASGEPGDPDRQVADAVRQVWASVWNFRAFEERSYRSIDHLAVGMALLLHPAFRDEVANGVALTNNPFDPEGLEPAFYVNAQVDEVSVVLPPPGVSTESFLYYFDRPDQPVVYLSRSNLIGAEDRVLAPTQVRALAEALDRLRTFFAPAYGVGQRWWAMDTEFKFLETDGGEPRLYIKQARPYQ